MNNQRRGSTPDATLKTILSSTTLKIPTSVKKALGLNYSISASDDKEALHQRNHQRHKRSVSDYQTLRKCLESEENLLSKEFENSDFLNFIDKDKHITDCTDCMSNLISRKTSTDFMNSDTGASSQVPTPLISKWDENVDTKATHEILKSLNKHIAETAEQLLNMKNEKTNQVGDFLNNMTNPDSKQNSESNIKRQFAEDNKQSNKLVKDLQTKLDSLNYRKDIIEEFGIPQGVNPKEYVKNLSRDKKKKTASSTQSNSHHTETTLNLPRMHKERSPFPQKSYSGKKVHRSASDENIAGKKIDSAYSSGTDRTNNSHTLTNLLGCDKRRGPSSLHNFTSNIVSSSTPNSNQAPSHADNSMRKVTGQSLTSSQSHQMENEHQIMQDYNQSISGDSPPDESTHSDPQRDSFLSGSGGGSTYNFLIKEEVVTLKKELAEAKYETNELKEQIETLKRDMKTAVDMTKLQNQNSAERVERLEILVDESNLKMQREFSNFKEEFRNLNEKLDYRLITMTRDLRDNIDSVSNSLNLLGNRVEQLPHLEGRKDPLVVYDNIWNAAVSLVALLMVIISGCFQLLIRIVNLGATVIQHRTLFTCILVPATVYLIIKTYWPTFLDNFSDFLHKEKTSSIFSYFKS